MHIARAASEATASRCIAAIEAAFEPVRHFPFAAPAREQFASGLRVTCHVSRVTFHDPYAIYDIRDRGSRDERQGLLSYLT